MLSSGTRNNRLRSWLLGCLLTYAFESWSGQHTSSLKHVQFGLMLLQIWFKDKHSLQHSSPTSWPPITSPTPSTLEDELIHTFGCLDIVFLNYIDILPLTVHARITAVVTPEPNSVMPTVIKFISLDEATLCWEDLLNRVETTLLSFRPPSTYHSSLIRIYNKDSTFKSSTIVIRASLPPSFLEIRDRALRDLI
jgi:hypothetical protein